MNILPIEKQFEIMDLIYQKLPDREIATRANIPKSTVQNYKKRGPPIYRKYQRIPLIIRIQKQHKKNSKWQDNNSRKSNYLIINSSWKETLQIGTSMIYKRKDWKDTEIGRLNRENIEKERQLSFIQEKFDELVSLLKV